MRPCSLPVVATLVLALIACEDEPSAKKSESTGSSSPSTATPTATNTNADDTPIPEVGSPYEAGGSDWTVLAAGRDSFEYTAGEGSVTVAVLGVGPVANLVPGKGAKIRVDPKVPMLWVNGKEENSFKKGRAIADAARGKVVLLLELVPAKGPRKEAAHSGDANLRLVDFPHTSTTAEVGQFVFAPNDSSFADGHDKASKHRYGRFSWGVATLASKGERESELSSRGSKWTIPNAYLIPIPKGGTAEKGSVVSASRYGNTFDRAYIMDVGDKVKANFMRSMPFDKDHSAALKPDQFIPLTKPFQPGSPVAVRIAGRVSQGNIAGADVTVKSADSLELFTIIRASGDKVLLTGHMGKIAMAPKSAMLPVPLRADVKKAAQVVAVWDTLHFRDAEVVKIDSDRGHYVVKFEGDKEAKRVPFGELLAGRKADYLGNKN